MPLNSYATLGRSGLRVSPFCLGAMTFGEDWGWGATPEDSSKIIGTFLERGGNFVDTANFYTKGHSEKIIGDFIAQDRARRERIGVPGNCCANEKHKTKRSRVPNPTVHGGERLRSEQQAVMSDCTRSGSDLDRLSMSRRISSARPTCQRSPLTLGNLDGLLKAIVACQVSANCL